MTHAFVLGVLVSLLFSSSALAQNASLTDAQIETAIALGMKAKGKEQGLDLQDTGQGWAAAFNASLGATTGTNTGFSVIVYTPTTWIRQQASQAAKQYRPFTVADVTEEMREPILRVIIHADMPNFVTASGAERASSVEHAVLRDKHRKTAVQPTYLEPFTEEAMNAMGAKKNYQSLQAKFPLDGLRELRGSKGDEFFLTVVGERQKEKDFEVKRKHFERIP